MKASNTRVCSICGAINLAQDQVCLSCGAWLGSATGDSPAGNKTGTADTQPCPHCGQSHPPGTLLCPIYARPISATTGQQTVCLNCGNALEPGATYCGYCGAIVENRSAKPGTWLRIVTVMVAGLVALLVFIAGLFLLFQLLLGNNQATSSDQPIPPTALPTMTITQPAVLVEASATVSPSPIPTWTPAPRLTDTPFPTIAQPSSPVFGQPTDCNGLSYLQTGMTAYVRKPLYIYDIPRFQTSPGKPDPVIMAQLTPGDQVIILEHESSPYCYHNKTYFWYVQPEIGDAGFAYEFTFVHKARDIVTQPAGDGYYLSAFPP